MQTLVGHAITVKQYNHGWRVDWDNLQGHQTRWFDTFEEVSQFVEGDLIA